MTRKKKIIASVAVLSMAIFGMIVGVYAIVQRQLAIGGTVSFSASTVRANYRILKSDAYTGETMGALTEVATGTFNEDNQNNATEALGNITLTDNTERFAYQVVITSTETVRDLHVSYTVPTLTQDWLTVLVNDSETPTTTAVIAAGDSLTVTFVIIADAYNAPETAENIDIGTNFIIGLSEADSAAEAQARVERQARRLAEKNQTINNMSGSNYNNMNNSYNNITSTNQNVVERQSHRQETYPQMNQ